MICDHPECTGIHTGGRVRTCPAAKERDRLYSAARRLRIKKGFLPKKRVKIVPEHKASHSSRGAASELRACASLLEAGYHVFRSLSPACPFDLVAQKDGKFLRVEVKSLGFNPHGFATFAAPRNREWDLLMVVGEAEIFQFTPAYAYQDCLAHIREKLSGVAPGNRATELARVT
jgi:PD-(D/E)XK endonuclease